MKNLYQRLNQDIKDNLLADKEDYPNLIGELIEALEKNVAVTELTLDNINQLSSFSPKYITTILEIYDMFDK